MSDIDYDNKKLSVSMMIDNRNPNECDELLSISPRQTHQWTPDDLVDECYNCKSKFKVFFGYITGKHHCRRCGRVFCSECSKNSSDIPEIIPCSVNTNYVKSLWDHYISNDVVKLCDYCYDMVVKIKPNEKYIDDLKDKGLSISDFKMLIKGIVGPNFYNDKLKNEDKEIKRYIAKFFISSFRNIQYSLPNHEFTEIEKNILWNNRYFIIGHSKYHIQLLKCFINDIHKLNEILSLKSNILDDVIKDNNDKDGNCKYLMCSRTCNGVIDVEDLCMILVQDLSLNSLRRFVIHHFSKISNDHLLNYLPIIINQIKYDTPKDPIIQDFIESKIEEDIKLYNKTYWYLRLQSLSDNEIYFKFLQKLVRNKNNDMFVKIKKGDYIVDVLHSTNSLPDFNDKIKMIKSKIITQEILNPFYLDTSCEVLIDEIKLETTGASNPLLIPLSNGRKILYKTEDVRKDLLVMNLIRNIKRNLVQDEELKSLNLDLDIITYDIIPTGNDNGLIEIVGDCDSLEAIRNRYEGSNSCILNYMMENNKSENSGNLRRKFMNSCAVYCCLTYLLGINDRHLNNIMVTKKGEFFHIDYGFILGEGKKVIPVPRMKMTDDIINALGKSDESVNEFSKTCTKIYNCLRRHINIFIVFMTTLLDLDPKLKCKGCPNTKEVIIKRLIDRFTPGEEYNQAGFQFYKEVRNCSKTNYNNSIIDYIHHHNQNNTLFSYFTKK